MRAARRGQSLAEVAVETGEELIPKMVKSHPRTRYAGQACGEPTNGQTMIYLGNSF